jgi:hypothetical protein
MEAVQETRKRSKKQETRNKNPEASKKQERNKKETGKKQERSKKEAD